MSSEGNPNDALPTFIVDRHLNYPTREQDQGVSVKDYVSSIDFGYGTLVDTLRRYGLSDARINGLTIHVSADTPSVEPSDSLANYDSRTSTIHLYPWQLEVSEEQPDNLIVQTDESISRELGRTLCLAAYDNGYESERVAGMKIWSGLRSTLILIGLGLVTVYGVYEADAGKFFDTSIGTVFAFGGVATVWALGLSGLHEFAEQDELEIQARIYKEANHAASTTLKSLVRIDFGERA